MSHSWTDRSFTTADGLALHYRDYPGSGDRPPLLCLHGLTRNSRDSEDFAEVWKGRFRVLTPDFRGRGKSERDPQPERYHPFTYANDILGLMEEAGVPEAVFVGTSLGGLVTMLVAGLQPERVAGAILNDIGPDVARAGIDRLRTYVGKPARFAGWDEAASAVAAINRHLPATFTGADWTRFARRVCRQEAQGIVFDYDLAIADVFSQPEPDPPFDMWPLFRALAQRPVLVLRGEHSDLLSPETLAAMGAVGGSVDTLTVAGVGHAPLLDEPDAEAAIGRFLSRWT